AVDDDVGANVARHHDGHFDVWRIDAEILQQRFRESLHRELGAAVGGVGNTGAERGPETVDAAGVDEVALFAGHQQRDEGATAVVDAAPNHAEGAVPLFPLTGEEAAATTDAGVVEEEVDVVCAVLSQNLVAEAADLGFVGDVA